MGGGLILVAMGLGTVLWADLSNRFVWILLATTLAFGMIGFYDDYLKLVVGNSKGLAARYKYLAQSVLGLAAALIKIFGPLHAAARALPVALEIGVAVLAFAVLCAGAALLRNLLARRLQDTRR